jgi:hypothetical protein
MNTKQTAETNWPISVIVVSSIPIILIIVDIIIAVIMELNARDGIHNTTYMNAAIFGGLYLAIPCGLLNIIVCNFARSRGLVGKKLAGTGIFIGVIGILIGLITWIMFSMILSFAASF